MRWQERRSRERVETCVTGSCCVGQGGSYLARTGSTLAAIYYQQALALVEALGMPPLAAHCRHRLGRLHGQSGRRAPARAALTAAMALYRAMHMTFWLPQAADALAQVEAGYTPEGTVAQR